MTELREVFTPEQAEWLEAWMKKTEAEIRAEYAKKQYSFEREQLTIINERIRAVAQTSHYSRPDMWQGFTVAQAADMLNRIGETIENMCDEIGVQLSEIEFNERLAAEV